MTCLEIWNEESERCFVMRKRLVGSAVAVVAVLVLSSGIFVLAAAPQGDANAAAPDLTGIWRRARRAPDNAHKYNFHEISGTLTNEEPPMTPWGEAKFKAAKPNIGRRGVPISQSNDPVTKCFPPGVPRVYELGPDFQPRSSGYLGDPGEVERRAASVRDQASKPRPGST